ARDVYKRQFLNDNQIISTKTITSTLMNKLSLPHGTNTIKLSTDTDKELFYSLAYSGFPAPPPSKPAFHGIAVTRSYTNSNGEKIKEAKLGEDVRVTLRLRSETGHDIGNVAIVDLIPAGFEIVPDSTNGYNSLEVDYYDVREDRLIIYATVRTHSSTFEYKLHPIGRGVFTLPAVHAGSMYQLNTWGDTGVSGVIEIK
ncbi:MAG: hypothetical protein D6808_05220, partial [Candidatus Dadabacteria bacterium]